MAPSRLASSGRSRARASPGSGGSTITYSTGRAIRRAAERTGPRSGSLLSVIGVGMRSHAGVAQRMFTALGERGINIQVISTSEIKTSVVVDEKYMELAVRVLHREFGLDKAPDAEKMRP